MRPALFLLLAAILCALNAPGQDIPAPAVAPPQSAPPVAAVPPAAPVTTTPVQTLSTQATPSAPAPASNPLAVEVGPPARLEARIERLEDKRIDEALAQVERNSSWFIWWTQVILALFGVVATIASTLFIWAIKKTSALMKATADSEEQVENAQEQTEATMRAAAEAEEQIKEARNALKEAQEHTAATMAAAAEAEAQVGEARDALKESQEQTASTMTAVAEAKQQLEEAKTTLKEAQDLSRKVKQMYEDPPGQPPSPETIQAASSVADNEDAEMPDRLMAKALILEYKKKWKEALTMWGAIVTLQPTNARALFGVAYCIGGLADLEQDKAKKQELLRQACDKYAKAVEANPRKSVSWYNWGVSLGQLADLEKDNERKQVLLNESCEMYDKAVKIDPGIAVAWDNWGNNLSKLADLEKDDEAKRRLFRESGEMYARAVEADPKMAVAWANMSAAFNQRAVLEPPSSKERAIRLDQAEQAALKAHELVPGEGVYNLACVAALRGDKKKCRKWLTKAEEIGDLPTLADLDSDTDMDPVRGEEWFKELLERMRAREAEASEEDEKA